MTAKRERFTDAEYAEMSADYAAKTPTADEVVSGHVNAAFLRKGRPTEGAAPGKTRGFTVRLPDPIRVELTVRARAEGASPSELIRRAVVEYIENHPAECN
jgi:anti-sigma factor RsiW